MAGPAIEDLIVTQEIMQDSGHRVLTRGRENTPEDPGHTGSITGKPGRHSDKGGVRDQRGDIIKGLSHLINNFPGTTRDNLDVKLVQESGR
jgi:hypothetical protein